MVIDADGDGKAEMAVKTAPGTKDGTGNYIKIGPAASATHTMIYRNSDGYVLSGPEYLTVFNGQTGAEMATVDFPVQRGTVSSWGDSYGNRVDRFLADGRLRRHAPACPASSWRAATTRGRRCRAMNWRGGQLTQLWQFDSNTTPKDAAGHTYSGQGSHSMTVANVDDDPSQELMYGAMAIDNTGAGLCSTGYNHGDAEHVGDLIPSRPGLEFFMCNEDGAHPAYHIRDARTCAIIQEGPINGADTGRCVADDISASNPGAEMWASSIDGLISATTNANLGVEAVVAELPGLVGRRRDARAGGRHVDQQVRRQHAAVRERLRLEQRHQVDAGADRRSVRRLARGGHLAREQQLARCASTRRPNVTTRRIYTLMHDAQYRMQVSAEQTAYNQPPHPGFHIGNGMVAPPAPNIQVVDSR